jgi:hypothetical protein
VPARAATREHVDAAIAAVNGRLPDYARIGDYVIAEGPFAPANGQLTTNGRNRRATIWNRYCVALDALYDDRLDLTA